MIMANTSVTFVIWSVFLAVILYFTCIVKQEIVLKHDVTVADSCHNVFSWLKEVKNREAMPALVKKMDLLIRVENEATGDVVDTIQVTESIPLIGDIHFISTVEAFPTNLTFHHTGDVWWGLLNYFCLWELKQTTVAECKVLQTFHVYVPLVFKQFTEEQAKYSHAESFVNMKKAIELL